MNGSNVSDEEHVVNKAKMNKALSTTSSSSSSAMELAENIQFMKLIHELKAIFPTLSDSSVKKCVIKVSLNSMQTIFVH